MALETGGALGAKDIPAWYPLIEAARYLRVPPWELAVRPVGWVKLAQAAMSAEQGARKTQQKRQERRSRRGWGKGRKRS